MGNKTQTNEFSICLLPNVAITDQVEKIRRQLPPSPYRDDTPHITLLRGITKPGNVTDAQLLDDVQKIIQIPNQLPIEVNVSAVVNESNQFYSESGLLLIQPSVELTKIRQETIKKLTNARYDIDDTELVTYRPHLTIRLGCKLEGDMLQGVRDTFQDKTISFEDWALFRLEFVKGSRKMRELHI